MTEERLREIEREARGGIAPGFELPVELELVGEIRRLRAGLESLKKLKACKRTNEIIDSILKVAQ